MKLKWKAARHCHQETHCGTYWVERDPDGGHFGRWHAHRKDLDEQLTNDGFATRAEAKAYCQQDYDETPRECAECHSLAVLTDGVCDECRREECPTCEGTGYDPNGGDGEDDTCEDCGGDGVI